MVTESEVSFKQQGFRKPRRSKPFRLIKLAVIPPPYIPSFIVDKTELMSGVMPALFVILILILVLFLTSCGRGGATLTGLPFQQEYLNKTQAESTESLLQAVPDGEYQLLEDLAASIEQMPDTAFATTADENWLKHHPRLHEVKLMKILDHAERAILNENFKNAQKILEEQFIPKTDGCSGGKPENDIVVYCPIALDLFGDAQTIIAQIKEITQQKQPKQGRTANAVDLTTFKNSLLQKLDGIRTTLSNAPDSAFKAPEVNSKKILLDHVDIARILMESGDLDGARNWIRDNLFTLIDGGDGGSKTDDLLQTWFYSTPEYFQAITLVHKFLQDLKITQITITPTPSNRIIEAGQSIQFTAACIYSSQVEKDCTTSVNWFSSDASIAAITSAGKLAAATSGDVSVYAQADTITSNTAAVKIVGAGVFWDDFDLAYLNPQKWNNVFQYGSSIEADGARLNLTGGTYAHAQVMPVQYFNIAPGERVEMELTADPGASGGSLYIQGFGIYDRRSNGLAIGVVAGSLLAAPKMYLASPLSYKTVPLTNPVGAYRVVYQNGIATVTLNGSFIAQIPASLDGMRATFFMYASAGSGSSIFDLYFDNFITNQPDPGETAIEISNMTRPFLSDGSGGLFPGESFRLRLTSSPHLSDVRGKLVNAVNFLPLMEFAMKQTATPGVYEYNGVMPAVVPAVVAFSASDDGFNRVELYTQRVATVLTAPRTLVRTTEAAAGEFKPTDFLPEFLLPLELRNQM
ncbi:MAG: Ig-like domain-containing protein [bacterium]